MTAAASSGRPERVRLPLLDDYLREQRTLTAVERFAEIVDEQRSAPAVTDAAPAARRYRERLPATPPGPGQQYASRSISTPAPAARHASRRATTSTASSLRR